MNGKHQLQEEGLSGVRLMTFLTNHQVEILNREKNNERFIHLYGFGVYWVAFGQSAYQLCQLFPRSETSVINFASYPFPVVMAHITENELKLYSRQHILRTVDLNYKILTVPALPFERYKDWHRTEVEELT